jgi:ABC-type sugar transport system substrate-binding protein
MKKHQLFFLSLIICLIFVITACTKTLATVTPSVETEVPVETAVPTEEFIPTATIAPTEEPAIPCTITFESNRDGNWEIYRMAPDGSETVNLTNDPADDTRPVWSPDGTRIAFVSNRAISEEEGGLHIFVMNADGSDLRQLTFNHWSDWPSWSSDGSMITYTDGGDIFIINADGNSEPINLTNSIEKDERSAWSPDGTKIAWSSGGDGQWNLFVMDTDGSNRKQITDNGQIYGATWTIDGRLLTGWGWKDQQEFCQNCVVTADGLEIVDGGGKGTLVNFVPFVTADGERVELAAVDSFEGNPEIYILSDKLPDTLGIGVGIINLTNNPADDTNANWPANCVSGAQDTVAENTPQETQVLNPEGIVIGYEGDPNQQREEDLKKACSELQIQCVEGNDIPDLVEQGVDAILSFSNQWKVLGDSMALWSAVEKSGIPVFVLNADSDRSEVYNLSADLISMRSSVEWMLKEMGGQGDFVYYNFGDNNLYRDAMEGVLKEFPDVNATSMPASWETDSIKSEEITALVESNPNLGAIWANNEMADLFWGVNAVQSDELPSLLCEARQDSFENWKNQIEQKPGFKCYASIQPGGTAYEGVYVAYYVLTGLQIDPAALGGMAGNTFLYDYPVITNENLDEWLGKLDTLRKGDWDKLEMPPMTPEEIKEKWFLE